MSTVVDTTIPATMRAVQCHAIKDYRQDEVPVPEVNTGEVLIRVSRCGLCAGDAKCYTGADMFWSSTYGGPGGRPYVEAPCIPGHEFCGVVVALGEGAGKKHNVGIGDLVTSEQVIACGSCLYCRRGWRWLCAPHVIYGFKQAVSGGVAEYMLFPAHAIVHKLPKGLPSQEAVYIEPLSCAAHGATIAGIELGDTVVASGCGPIGLGFIAFAKRRSPQRIIAVDCIDSRLELARKCGADICLNPTKDNVVAAIRGISDSRLGCDVYFEATGSTDSVTQGLQSCRKAATFVEFSVFTKPATVDWTVIGDTKSITIKGGHCSGERGYQLASQMLASGAMPVSEIVNYALPMSDIVSGLEMVSNPTDSVKVTIDPSFE